MIRETNGRLTPSRRYTVKPDEQSCTVISWDTDVRIPLLQLTLKRRGWNLNSRENVAFQHVGRDERKEARDNIVRN